MRVRGGFAVILGLVPLVLWSCTDEDLAGTKSAPGVVASATPYAVLPAATIVAVVPPPTPPPPITPRPTATPERVTYKVVAGDSPGSIATKFDVSTSELLRVNNITNPSSLQIGQELIIPGAVPTPTPAGGTPTATATPKSTATATPTATATATTTPKSTATPSGTQVYVVVAGDTAIDIATTFGITVAQLAAANSTTEAALRNLQIGQRLTIPAR